MGMIDSSWRVLVTGGVGFIGYHTAARLKGSGADVTVVDNFCADPGYDPKVKRDRANELTKLGVHVLEQDVEDRVRLNQLFAEKKFTHVVHLAGHGNVGQSLNDPALYMGTNVVGCFNVFDAGRLSTSPDARPVVVFATSSSVYGDENTLPFSEDEQPKPMSWYGETKLIDERIARQFHRQWGMPSIGLRFFTVYGPWGRPDMAVWKFADKMTKGEEITLFQREGVVAERDFAYIDDIVDGVVASLLKAKTLGAAIINLGSKKSDSVKDLVDSLAKNLNCTPRIKYAPLPSTDPVKTCAKMDKARQLLGVVPQVTLEAGIARFAPWFKEYIASR